MGFYPRSVVEAGPGRESSVGIEPVEIFVQQLAHREGAAVRPDLARVDLSE
jgi:hypothetical protein